MDLRLTLALRDEAAPVDAGIEFETPSGPVRAMLGDRAPADAFTILSLRAQVPAGATSASVVLVARGETLSAVDAVTVWRIVTMPGLFHDDLDTLADWTITGSGFSTQCVGSECWMKVEPASGPTIVARREVDLDVGDTRTVSVDFLGSQTGGGVDTELIMNFDGFYDTVLTITDGNGASNNGVRLGVGSHSSGIFYSWPQTNTWYRASVVMDLGAQTMQVVVSVPDGEVLATSGLVSTVELPSTYLDHVRIQGTRYSSGGTYGWDRIHVE